LKERVIHYLEAERHARYKVFIEHDPRLGFAQFYEGLRHVDPNDNLGFEEVLIELAHYLPTAHREDPAFVTDEVLRIGCSRLLWCIDSFIHEVESCYASFAERLINNPWRVVTFNWDTLVERSISEAGGAWSYSLAGPGVPIIKPHGSINWSAHAQHQNLVAQYQGWRPIGPGSRLSFDGQNPLSNQDVQEINTDLRYCLYPGDPDVPTTNPDLQLLWNDVTTAINQSQTVVFIGYSLPAYDTHAGGLFRQLCANKQVVVYDPSPNTRARFTQELPHAVCHDRRFNGTPYAQP
jgi:hypothetical protein